MKREYSRQSSLILYFLSAAGKTFEHGSSKPTRKDLNGSEEEEEEAALLVVEDVDVDVELDEGVNCWLADIGSSLSWRECVSRIVFSGVTPGGGGRGGAGNLGNPLEVSRDVVCMT